MSGSFMPVRGSSGVAPITHYFGALLPDKINLLQSTIMGASVGASGISSADFNVCNFFSSWVPFNLNQDGGSNVQVCAFSSFTTAPDGTTNTAKLLHEDSTNNLHFATAGWAGGSISNFGRVRVSGFFKYGGRRLCLQFSRAQRGTGLYCIFDLLNGQIGVAPTLLNPGSFNANEHYDAPVAEMVPFGNGWYRCSLECYYVPSGGAGLGGYIMAMLDNGTGTGARSVTYSGDGASGIYGWKTNALPSRAYALNNTTFFDDFNSISTIDVNNTQAPGFNWYVNQVWPTPSINTSLSFLVNPLPPPPGGPYTVSGSALNSPGTTGIGTNFSTITWTAAPANGAPVPLISAGASWAAGATTITMGVSNPGTVTPGMNVFSCGALGGGTQFRQIGTVLSYIGTTLTLTQPAIKASFGSTDQIQFQNQSSYAATGRGRTFTKPMYLEYRVLTDTTQNLGEGAIWCWDTSLLWDVTGSNVTGVEMDWWDTLGLPDINSNFLGWSYRFTYASSIASPTLSGVTKSYFGIVDWQNIHTIFANVNVCWTIGSNNFWTAANNNFNDPPPSANWTTYAGPSLTLPAPKEANGTVYNVYSILLLPLQPGLSVNGDNAVEIAFYNGVVTSFQMISTPNPVPGDGTDQFQYTMDGRQFPIFLGPTKGTSIDYVKVIQ